MPTIRYCRFCEREHKFQIEFDEEAMTFELWCDKYGLLVERVAEQDQFERFFELKWQFIPPPEE